MTPRSLLPFGDLLRGYRMAAGLTQEELAERANVSVDAISNLERGFTRAPHRYTVRVLSEALRLAPEDRTDLETAARGRGAAASAAEKTSTQPEGAHAGERPRPIGGFLGALPSSPLVAREAELARVLAASNVVRSGSGRLVLLAGEPGIGKTRLAQEVSLAAHERGYLVATGRCYAPAQTVAYYPFHEAISWAYSAAPLTVREALPERWPDVFQLLPDVTLKRRPAPPASSAAWSGEGMEQQRLFWAVTGFVRALTRERPVALLVDDLHWADSASLALLTHLARHTRTFPVLLLGTYRGDAASRQPPLEALLRDLGREQLCERVTLGPLPEHGITALAVAAFGEGAVSSGFVTLLHQHTEGNPFFAHEVLRALVERGDLAPRQEDWTHALLAQARVPETVRAVIRERVGRLSEAAQETLREASALGQTFSFDDLAGMQMRPEEELERALDEATAADLIRESGTEEYTFHHVLIMQALYDELSSRKRQRLHRMAGAAIERQPAGIRERRVAELAYHFLHGHDADKALPYLMQAAENARVAGAFREEVSLLDQAVALAERVERESPQSELLAKRGLAYHALSLWREADADLTAALAGLEAGARELRARVLVALAQIRQFLHDEAADTRRFATEALALADAIGRDDLAASAISTLGVVDSFDSDLHASLAHFQQAFARAGPEHLASVVSGVEFSGLVEYWLGDAGRAIERERQAIVLAGQLHNTATTGTMLQTLGLALAATGRYREGFEALAEAERVARDYGARQWLARCFAIRGGLHLAVGDYSGAQRLAEEARELSRSAGWPHATVSAGIDLVVNYARRYEPERADELVDELTQAVAGDQSHKRWLWQLRLAQARADVALARGQWAEALRWAEESLNRNRRHGRLKYEVAGLGARARARAQVGQQRDAIGDLRHAVGLARTLGDPAVFLRVAAVLLALDGDDALLAEARVAAERIQADLPDSQLQRAFQDAEPMRLLAHVTM